MDPRPTNPKDLVGRKKPQLWLIPGPGLIHLSLAFKNGGDKYGPYNWRDNAVLGTVYVDAALRHLHEYLDGQDLASDSGVHHLAHAAACCFIILDALETGNLKDDRPTKGPTSDLIERFKLDKTDSCTTGSDGSFTASPGPEPKRSVSTGLRPIPPGTQLYYAPTSPKEGRTEES